MSYLSEWRGIGRVGADASVRQVGDHTVVNFRLAVTPFPRNGKKGVTTWRTINVWGKYGTAMQPYIVKGAELYIEGEEVTEEWQKNGETVSQLAIRASKVIPLGERQATASTTQESTAPTEELPF